MIKFDISFLTKYGALIVIITGLAISLLLYLTAPTVQKNEAADEIPVVSVMKPVAEPVRQRISTSGSVEAKRRIDFSSEVAGRVTYVAKNFVPGGRIRAGEVLLKVDPRNYELALRQAELQLANARQQFIQEQETQRLAIEDWEEYGGEEPSTLARREPQMRAARAQERSAQAQVRQAKLDLERTVVRAPFNGFVESRSADLGQVIATGAPIAVLFGSDIAEIRLPISQRHLDQLGQEHISRLSRGLAPQGLDVTLYMTGQQDEGEGITAPIVRAERVLNQQTRLYTLVAEIRNPFERFDQGILAVGSFLQAEIIGRQLDDTVRIPASSILDNDKVLLVLDDNTVVVRTIELHQRDGESAIVSIPNLQQGHKVITNPLRQYYDGMPVKITCSSQDSNCPKRDENTQVDSGKDEVS